MRDPNPALPRKSLIFITPLVALLATLAVLAFIVGFIFWDSQGRYREALAAQDERAVWGAELAASQATRQLAFLALVLDGQSMPGRPIGTAAKAPPGPELDAALNAMLERQPILGGALAWDSGGAMLAGVGRVLPETLEAETRLRDALAGAGIGAGAFRVLSAGIGTDRAPNSVLVAARWTDPPGESGARLIALVFDPAQAESLFQIRPPRSDGLIGLAFAGGQLLGTPAGLGPDTKVPEIVLQAIARAQTGLLPHVAWPDGVHRRTAFRRMDRNGLVAIAGASEVAADEAYQRALRRNPSIRAVVILLVATIGITLAHRTRRQRTLMERIALWEQAAESSPYPMLVLDARQADLPVMYANPAFGALVGMDRGAVTGQPCPLLASLGADPKTVPGLVAALAGGEPFHGEIATRDPASGAPRSLLADVEPVRDSRQVLTNFVCRLQDVTERRRAAEAERAAQAARDWALDELRKALDRVASSEGRFRDFAASASDWFWETDISGRITWLSENAHPLAGWRIGDRPALPELLGPDGNRKPPADFRDARATGHGRDGHRILEVSGRPVLAQDGSWQGYRGVVKDITEQELAAAAARREEQRLAAAVEHLPIGLMVVDAEGKVLLCNARYCDLFGVERPRRGDSWLVVGRVVLERLRPQLTPAVLEALVAERRRLTAAGQGSMSLPWLDGRTYRLEERLHEGGDRTVVVVDVTELEESRARLLDAVESISSGFAIFDISGRLVLANSTFHDQVAPMLPDGELGAMSVLSIFGGLAEAGRLRLMQIDGRPASREEITTRVELATGDPFLMDTLDGRTLQVRLRESGEGGRVAMFSDVSLLRQMDAALRASEAKFRGLAQASGDAILIVDELGDIQFANREAHRMFGYDDEDSVLDNIASLIPAESRPLHGTLAAGFFAEKRSRAMASARQLRAVRSDGSTFPVEVVLSYYETPDGPLVQANVRDVTLRLRAEESERQRGKMVALGTLAGGIAHDLNNALVPILTLGELLLDSGTLRPEEAEMMSTIITAAERARDLVRNILAFSRRGVRQVKTLDLGVVVAQDMAMLRAVIPAQIRLDYEPPAEPVPVSADESNLHQVVINLVSNAAQAIGGRSGRIELAVAIVEQPESAADGPPGGSYGQLVVADDGPGMDEATRQRLFEPFFTTKPVGEGTGLGLAIVHGIVTSHGGTISLDSTPGEGTRFTIWFPLRPARQDIAAPADGASS